MTGTSGRSEGPVSPSQTTCLPWSEARESEIEITNVTKVGDTTVEVTTAYPPPRHTSRGGLGGCRRLRRSRHPRQILERPSDRRPRPPRLCCNPSNNQQPPPPTHPPT